MPHVDESKRMKLFGDLTRLADRNGHFVDRGGRRVGDADVAQEHDTAQAPEAPVTGIAPPATPPRTLTPPRTSVPSPSLDVAEICAACPANGSCPNYCVTCGGKFTIVGPCPIGRW